MARQMSSSDVSPRMSSSSRSRPLKSVAFESLTRIARRTKCPSRSDSETPSSRAGPSANLPSRSASAADSSGESATTAVIRPGRTRNPDLTSTRSPRGDALLGSAMSTASGCTDITWQIRAPATSPRIILLAVSVPVRSGTIRNAEYP